MARLAEAQELFGPLGVTNIRTFVDPEQPTRRHHGVRDTGADGVVEEVVEDLFEALLVDGGRIRSVPVALTLALASQVAGGSVPLLHGRARIADQGE